jgi:hypothetical protein
MERKMVNRIIKFELRYIPKGSKGTTQNRLRFYYVAYRRKGLAKGLSRDQCLKDAIDKLKKDHPEFDPEFDEDFFKIPRKSFLQKLVNRIRFLTKE